MAMTCRVCNSPNREAIDKALLSRTAFRHIAAQYGTSTGALQRHKREHLPQALVKAREAREVANGDTLLQQMTKLNLKAQRILTQALKDGDGDMALKAMAECRKNLELQGRLIGELEKSQSLTVSRHLHLHGISDDELASLAESGELPIVDDANDDKTKPQ